MVKDIMKFVEFLKIKSIPATIDDINIADDLLDTLKANKDRCVGLAANMIGVSKCIIVFEDKNGRYAEMFNPKIIKGSGLYDTEEGCLSLVGVRATKRYETIKVEYQTRDFQNKVQTYKGFTAQIIQHEIDHCNGIII